MGVRHELGRALAIVFGTLLVGAVLESIYLGLLCPKASYATKAARHAPVSIDSGFRFARPGEMIVTCTTPHHVGPIVFHDDLDCYCVPTGTDLDALGLRIAGRCSIDKLTPNPADTDGVCRHAHCTDFR